MSCLWRRSAMAALVLTACTPAEPDAEELAAEALVWGYPLVVSERTMQTLGGVIGVNALFNQAALAGAGTNYIVSPNQDTLYSIAVLDL
ncbi:MAG TPA: DUF1254 domain-containing protein, partial [Polyangiaceae bacterium]|nr:DUF1254 domain-containing protein [Polyangiaceae bacterium]